MLAATVPFALLIAGAASLAGCTPDRANSVFSSSGGLCFESTPTGSVKARVTFPVCLSSSCDEPVVAVCGVKMDDRTIRVSSRGELFHGDFECTSDCGAFTTDCESAPIAPGVYAVTYGSESATVSLPVTQQILFSSGTGLDSCPD
jgi:hypothetical protein